MREYFKVGNILPGSDLPNLLSKSVGSVRGLQDGVHMSVLEDAINSAAEMFEELP